jgi:hypothetical protein
MAEETEQIAYAGLKDSEYKQAAVKSAARSLYRQDNPKERDIASSLVSLFGSGPNNQLKDTLTEDLYRRLKFQYSNLIATDPSKSSILNDGLKPISSFIGSVLLNLTGMQEDSLGSKFDLPNTLSSMLEKTNPELHAKFKSTYETFNAQKLSEMPSSLFGNAKQLTENAALSGQSGGTGLLGKISLPQGLQDTYRGAEDLVGKANDFVNNTLESLQKQFSKINKLIPKELTGVLENAGKFSGQIENITKQFGGIEQIQSITKQLNIGTGDFSSILQQNPLQTLGGSLGSFGSIDQFTSFLKNNPLQSFAQGGLPDVGGILNKAPNIVGDQDASTGKNNPVKFSLPDPKEALKQFLPKEITGGLENITNISGFGFTGNIPFGLEKALEGIGTEVFKGILDKFSSLLPFLASGIAGTAGPGDQPNNYPSNEANVTESPDGSTPYVVDQTSGTIIKDTPPKPVYSTNIPGTTTTRASESGAGRFASIRNRNATQGSQGAATAAVGQGAT